MSGHDLVKFSRVYWWEEWSVGKEIEKGDGGRVGMMKESVVGGDRNGGGVMVGGVVVGIGMGEVWWWER